MASLFRLRRCICAASFRRSYTASGIFFKVRVVGTALYIQYGTIMVPVNGTGLCTAGSPVARADSRRQPTAAAAVQFNGVCLTRVAPHASTPPQRVR